MARKKKVAPPDPKVKAFAEGLLLRLVDFIHVDRHGVGWAMIEDRSFDGYAMEVTIEALTHFKAEIEADMVSEQERDGVGE